MIQTFRYLYSFIFILQIESYNHSGKLGITHWLCSQSMQITRVSIAEIPVAVLIRCIVDLKNGWETPDLESYFHQLAGLQPASLLRKNSGTIVLLGNLQILFLRVVLQTTSKQLIPRSTTKHRCFLQVKDLEGLEKFNSAHPFFEAPNFTFARKTEMCTWLSPTEK